jgi:peptidoglycan/LPS O-acetylase OafA/YrhL
VSLPEQYGPDPTPAPVPPPRRLAILDAFRAIAVLLVLGRHILDVQYEMPPAVQLVLRPWNRFGWIGVDFFFVLSGFLVSGLLFSEYVKHGRLRPLWFLGRRGFKIYPGFYLLLAITWLWRPVSVPLAHYAYEAVFVQNYLGFVWNHTWSLAVEEHFYLGLTLTLWALARWRGGPAPFRSFPWICAVVLPLVLALRTRAFAARPRGYLLLPTHFRIDALLFGVLLAYAWHFHRAALTPWLHRYRWTIAIVSVLLLAPCLLLEVENGFAVNTIGLTTNYLGFGGLVILGVAAQAQESPRLARLLSPLAAIGFYSYSVYLWHMPVNLLAARLLAPRIGWPASVAAYLVGSIVVGIVAARLVELPFLRLRDRVLPSRTA